jgi:hypothetical protein
MGGMGALGAPGILEILNLKIIPLLFGLYKAYFMVRVSVTAILEA